MGELMEVIGKICLMMLGIAGIMGLFAICFHWGDVDMEIQRRKRRNCRSKLPPEKRGPSPWWDVD